MLLSRYQRPKALRRNGVSWLTSVLTGLGLPPLESREAKVNAAKSQHTSRPDQTMIADLAKEVTRRNERIAELDTAIEA